MVKKKVIVLSCAGLALLGFIFMPGYLRIKRLVRQNRELEERIEEIKKDNKRLAQEQEKLRSDPLYLEKVAREKLGVAKEGEIVYKVLPAPEDK